MSTQNLYMSVHTSIIHNRQKLDITEISFNIRKDKQILVYLFSGILINIKKEYMTNTCNGGYI